MYYKKNPSQLGRIFAIRTGLEPATSAVTGRHSNQLNYRIIFGGANINIFSLPPNEERNF